MTTLRDDGSPHVVPRGVALDVEGRVAWVITARTSQKVANLRRNPTVAVCQGDGRRWSTLGGQAEVGDDTASVAEAVRRYAERYRPPRENPDRVAIRLELTGVIGSV